MVGRHLALLVMGGVADVHESTLQAGTAKGANISIMNCPDRPRRFRIQKVSPVIALPCLPSVLSSKVCASPAHHIG